MSSEGGGGRLEDATRLASKMEDVARGRHCGRWKGPGSQQTLPGASAESEPLPTPRLQPGETDWDLGPRE